MSENNHGNAYNTDDPQRLLELKRLEAESLRDLSRSFFDVTLNESQLFRITRNTLAAQIKVNKLLCLYLLDGEWKQGILKGFPEVSAEAQAEILSQSKAVKVNTETQPTLAAWKAEYIIPVSVQNQISVYFVIAEFADSEVEVQNDIIFIETVGHILYAAIQQRGFLRAKVQQEYIKKELEVAGTIHNQLLISDFSRFKKIEVHATNIPHQKIGGDFYDIIPKGKDITFVCIADVSGKGISAALLMSNLQANLRALCAQFEEIELIISELNRLLYKITEGERFVTLFLAKIEHNKQQMSYINAGHNYPIFLQKECIFHLESQCYMLGAFDRVAVTAKHLTYHKGDSLCMFTDGVEDQENEKLEKYGIEPLVRLLQKAIACPMKHLTQEMLQDISHFKGRKEWIDDVTIMNIRF